MTLPAKKRTLVQIAAELRGQLISDPTAYVPFRLRSGLEGVLSRYGDHWILTLQRPNTRPAEAEVRRCRAVFGVPEETARRMFSRQVLMAKTRALVLYLGVEMTWWETP